MADDKSTQDTEQDTDATDFAVTLVDLNKGRVIQELSEKLREITKAVTATSKPGKLQLTVNIKPQKGVEGALLLSSDVRATVPKFETPASIFFATDDGELVRDDPHRQPLF